MTKIERMEALWERVRVCDACGLGKLASNHVFGDGNVSSRIVIVGEAPGAEEDKSGHPFMGMAGGLLTTALYRAGISRKKIFITNILKCHPPVDKVTRSGDRRPTPNETAYCRGYLVDQLKIISPRIIIALGGLALSGLIGTPPSMKITPLVGRTAPFLAEGFQSTIVITYHPRYIGYNQSDGTLQRRYEEIFKMAKDMAY